MGTSPLAGTTGTQRVCLTLHLQVIPVPRCRLGMGSCCNPGVCTQLNLSKHFVYLQCKQQQNNDLRAFIQSISVA